MLSGPSANSGNKENLHKRIYQAVKEAILEATLLPGEPISESQLAAELGTSRTPVREALRALEREGLVRTVLTRGTFVGELGVTDILEIYQLREMLESAAARMAAQMLDRAAVDNLAGKLREARVAVAATDFHSVRQIDREIHTLIIAATRNARLIQFMDQLGEQVGRIRALQERGQVSGSTVARQRLDSMLAELEQLVAALRRGDPDAAEAVMREHILQARKSALRLASPAGMQVTG